MNNPKHPLGRAVNRTSPTCARRASSSPSRSAETMAPEHQFVIHVKSPGSVRGHSWPGLVMTGGYLFVKTIIGSPTRMLLQISAVRFNASLVTSLPQAKRANPGGNADEARSSLKALPES